MRWIGWVIVALVLAAMTFARLTDGKRRTGRDPDWRPVPRESSRSDAAPARGDTSAVQRVRAASESL
jgi:hypothetical protein